MFFGRVFLESIMTGQEHDIYQDLCCAVSDLKVEMYLVHSILLS